MSPNAPFPPGSDFGASGIDISPTKTEFGGLPGGFPLHENVPCKNLMNMREGTVRSLLPLRKSISVFYVEVLGVG